MIRSLSNPRNAKILNKALLLGRQISSSTAVLASVGIEEAAAAYHGDFRELGGNDYSSNAADPSSAWSGDMSYASPEADFTGYKARSTSSIGTTSYDARPMWSGDLSFASPDSDFSSQMVRHQSTTSTDAVTQQKEVWDGPIFSGYLSYGSPESDWCAEAIMNPVLSSSMMNNNNLPRTYADALVEQNAAIVVTTAQAPHRIVHVNRAWEEMCGYTKMEVLNKSLSVIQGPDTNTKLAEATVERLLKMLKPVDMYLVNYRKSGERFTNHLSMGPMKMDADSQDYDYLVGVLEEVQPSQVPLRMVAYD